MDAPEPRTAASREEGEGLEGRKRKQALGAEEVEEKPTDAKRVKLEGERSGEGEESSREEKKDVEPVVEGEKGKEEEEEEEEEESNGTEEVDGPQQKLGTIADDGGFLSSLIKAKPYELKFIYQEGRSLYEGSNGTTEDGQSLFKFKAEIRLGEGKVLLTLDVRSKQGSSPREQYNFEVALVGKKGESERGCALTVTLFANNRGCETKVFERGSHMVDLLKERCSKGEMITFRVEEQ